MVKKLLFPFLLAFLLPFFSFATHIVGGSLSYEHLGGSTYRITLKLYRDCASGNAAFPGSVLIEIRQPNGAAYTTVNIPFPGANAVPPNIDTCVTNPGICLEEAVYSRVINNLPPNLGGYHVFYQYCCRNSSLTNVQNPLSTGESWYTYIPDNNLWLTNSSPVWTNQPVTFVCLGQPIAFDHSATDIDGDSLVYSLYQPFSDPAPTFPGNVCTFTPITYVNGYQASGPLNLFAPGSLTINQQGLLNGIPNALGQYVVGVRCQEYRNGIKIGEILRDHQFNVVVCPLPTIAQFTVNGGSCASSTVCFTNGSQNTNSQTTYFWDFGDGTVTTDTSFSQNPPCYTYPGLGPYTVTLITNYGGPCSDTTTQTIYIAYVAAAFTSNAPQCANTPVQFTDASTCSGNNTVNGWSWNFGDPPSGPNNTSNQQNPTHSFSSGGTYTVTLISYSALGCTDTITQTVTIQAAPIANAGLNDTSCTNNPTVSLGGTVLNATGGSWVGPGSFNPNNTTLNATYTPTPAEVTNGFTDLLLITTGNGLCTADTDTVHIVFTPGPTVDAGPDTIFVCKDTSGVPLNGVVTLATGGQWSILVGSGSFNPNNNQLSTTYVPSSGDTTQGFVILVLTTTGNGNCNPSRDTLRIQFTATPTATILAANDSACAGYLIPLNVTVSTGQGIWTSLGNGTFIPNNTVNNPSYQPGSSDITAGFVTLIFSSTNNGGCQAAKDTMVITLIPSPVAQFTNTNVCPWDTVSFTDATTSTTTVTGWSWNFGDPSSGVNNTSTQQNPSHIYSMGGPYTVTLIVTSVNGCVDTVQQVVNVFYQPVADFDFTGGCLNTGTIFNDTSTVIGSTITGWNWMFGDGSPISTLQDPVHIFPTNGSFPVTLIVTSAQGCMDTITIATTVFPVPTANFTADDFIAVIGQQINFTDQSTPVVSWTWNFGDDTTHYYTQNPVHSYANGGTFIVTLIVTDLNGCSDTITHEVIISVPPAVPSGFSPNGDGQNDILFVYGGPYKELEFRIYNNWGELIFTSFKQTDGWDGRKDGKPQPIGVYVWTVKGVTEDNVSHELKGDVSLLR